MRALLTVLALVCALVLQNFSAVADDPAVAKETVEVKAQELTLNVPKSWKQQQPSNNLRLAQFEVPSADGGDSIEVVVFPPFGGSVADNVKRWIEQFESKERKTEMVQGTSQQGKYVLVDLTGTYKKPDGPPILQKTTAVPGYRMVSVILTSPSGGNYFLKMVGPAASIESQMGAFRNSFGADSTSEKPYEM